MLSKFLNMCFLKTLTWDPTSYHDYCCWHIRHLSAESLVPSEKQKSRINHLEERHAGIIDATKTSGSHQWISAIEKQRLSVESRSGGWERERGHQSWIIQVIHFKMEASQRWSWMIDNIPLKIRSLFDRIALTKDFTRRKFPHFNTQSVVNTSSPALKGYTVGAHTIKHTPWQRYSLLCRRPFRFLLFTASALLMAAIPVNFRPATSTQTSYVPS